MLSRILYKVIFVSLTACLFCLYLMAEQTDAEAGVLPGLISENSGTSIAGDPSARPQTLKTTNLITVPRGPVRGSAPHLRAVPVVTRGDDAFVRTSAMVRGYRGFLPLQNHQQTSIQAQPGSLLDDFCRVYEGLCPESRRFDLPPGPARQFILQSEIASERGRWLTEQYLFQSRIGAGHFQGIRDRQHRQNLNLHFRLMTSPSQQYQHSYFMQATFLEGEAQTGAPPASAKSVHLGYRQDLRLSKRLSDRLAGFDYLTWELVRGQYSRDNSVTDTTRVRLAQLWQKGPAYVRLSTARARHRPPSGTLRGDYFEQIYRFEAGLTAASPHSFSAMFRYFHLRSARLSYTRTQGRFAHLLPWQAEQKDNQQTQISLLVTGAHSLRGISPFLMLQEVSADSSAFSEESRQYILSLGLTIQF